MHSFTGPAFDPSSGRQTKRLFFAVLLDEPARGPVSRIADWHRRERGMRGSMIRPDRYHVTLKHIGDYRGEPSPQIVDLALRIGDAVVASAFPATLNHAESFRGRPGRYPYILLGDEGVAGFHFLRNAICGAAISMGFDIPTGRFVPHCTLMYANRFKGPINVPTVSWVVREFVLVLSHVGETHYDILRRWRLRDSRDLDGALSCAPAEQLAGACA